MPTMETYAMLGDLHHACCRELLRPLTRARAASRAKARQPPKQAQQASLPQLSPWVLPGQHCPLNI